MRKNATYSTSTNNPRHQQRQQQQSKTTTTTTRNGVTIVCEERRGHCRVEPTKWLRHSIPIASNSHTKRRNSIRTHETPTQSPFASACLINFCNSYLLLYSPLLCSDLELLSSPLLIIGHVRYHLQCAGKLRKRT